MSGMSDEIPLTSGAWGGQWEPKGRGGVGHAPAVHGPLPPRWLRGLEANAPSGRSTGWTGSRDEPAPRAWAAPTTTPRSAAADAMKLMMDLRAARRTEERGLLSLSLTRRTHWQDHGIYTQTRPRMQIGAQSMSRCHRRPSRCYRMQCTTGGSITGSITVPCMGMHSKWAAYGNSFSHHVPGEADPL